MTPLQIDMQNLVGIKSDLLATKKKKELKSHFHLNFTYKVLSSQ